MANGKTTLDKEGCEFGRMVSQEFSFYKELLNKMDLKMDHLVVQVAEIKENQDRKEPFAVIGSSFVKYLISAVVGAASAAALLLIEGGF